MANSRPASAAKTDAPMGDNLAAAMLKLQINWQKSTQQINYSNDLDVGKEQTQFEDALGNSVTQYANGYVHTTFTDGSSEEVYPDGSYSYRCADGSGWFETANASGGFFNADGTRVAWDDEGNGIYNYPDGSVEYYRIDAGVRQAMEKEDKAPD